MRVIAGQARGLRLDSVPGLETRPTLDRVKEALFNILQPNIQGKAFLDLFAGNGGIGIEALSRGVDSAVFVDKRPESTKMIRTNLAKSKLQGGEILTMDVFSALRKFSKEGHKFDLIFLDPPYGKNLVSRTLHEIWQANILREQGIIIAEYGIKEEIKLDASKLIATRQKKYGDSSLGFFYCKEAASES